MYYLLAAVLHKTGYIVKALKGRGCIIQDRNSEVKLHVPDGVKGIILAKVYTDHASFLKYISKSDCIIGPICEFRVHQFNSEVVSSHSRYKIQIPHIVKDVKNVRQFIRVRHFNSDGNIQRENMDTDPEIGIQYDIDEKYVTIHTNHFSVFIITAEGVNCCASSASAHIFGSLRSIPQAAPLVSVKIYFSSILYMIEDYISVSFSSIRY